MVGEAAAEAKRRQTYSGTTPLKWATTNAQIVHPIQGRIAFAPYDYQAAFLQSSASRRLILKARQVGYSQVFAIEALYRAIYRRESTILLVSRSQDLAVNLLRYCYQAYNSLRNAPELIKQNESEMGLDNGSRIKSIPANRSTGRGFAASDVYLDEFAYAEYADDIYQSVSPALSQGGTLTIASTPNGKGNLFHRLWVGGDSFEKFRIDWRQCPRYWTDYEKARGVPAEESAWYLEHRPDYTSAAWAAEFDCDFSISGGQVFRSVRERIRPVTPEAHAGHQVMMGLDFGQSNDYTVPNLVCATCKQQIGIDRFNRMEWALARGRIWTLYKKFGVAMVVAESNSIGGPNIEAMQQGERVSRPDITLVQDVRGVFVHHMDGKIEGPFIGEALNYNPDQCRHGEILTVAAADKPDAKFWVQGEWVRYMSVMAFDTTPASKPPLIQALALAIERGEIGLLDYLPQTLELEAYQMTQSKNTGRPTYSAPPGAHDDTVMALALAWHGVLRGTVMIAF